jgi:hypothetical protein
MKRDYNNARASDLIKDLQELIKEHGDLECMRDDYGFYSVSKVVYVESSKESGKVGPYHLSRPVFWVH